eukprot:768193-Hanusia_phi.AAC.1
MYSRNGPASSTAYLLLQQETPAAVRASSESMAKADLTGGQGSSGPDCQPRWRFCLQGRCWSKQAQEQRCSTPGRREGEEEEGWWRQEEARWRGEKQDSSQHLPCTRRQRTYMRPESQTGASEVSCTSARGKAGGSVAAGLVPLGGRGLEERAEEGETSGELVMAMC